MSSTRTDSFLRFSQERVPRVDAALDRLLPSPERSPARLHEAMRYCVFAGGKRIRPLLAVLAGEALGAGVASLFEPAAALELIHTFSLVHDDLPALDDDDLRRGRPTVHVAYDEALAVLVGDALLNLGLEVLARYPEDLGAERRLANVVLVAEAVGTQGMIGGQVADLEAEQAAPEDPASVLEEIHDRKTGALLAASLLVGGSCAGADEATMAELDRFGRRIGLMFQIRDDILDVEGSAETLGKTAGKDQRAQKLTYPSLYGLDRSKRMLSELGEEATAAAEALPADRTLFRSLVAFLIARSS